MNRFFIYSTLSLLLIPFAINTKSIMTEQDKKKIVSLLKNIKKNSGIFTHKELLTRRINKKEQLWWNRAIVSTDLYIDRYGDEILNRSFDLVAIAIKKFIETQQKLFDLFQNNASFEEGMHTLQQLRLALHAIKSRDGKLTKTRYVNSSRKELQKMILNLKEIVTDAANTLDQQYVASSLERKKKEITSCNSLFPLGCK